MKILIVDDTRTITSIVQVYLMGWGLSFLGAADGMEGLEMAKAHKPDLIISYVKMPRMDGFELCAAVRADPALFGVPLILLTSLNDEASRQMGRLVGANAFLNKPIRVDELRTKVSSLLGLETKP